MAPGLQPSNEDGTARLEHESDAEGGKMPNVNVGFDAGEEDSKMPDASSAYSPGEPVVSTLSKGTDPSTEAGSQIIGQYEEARGPSVEEKRAASFESHETDRQAREIEIPIVFDETDEDEPVGRLATLGRLLYRRRGLLFAIASALCFSFEDVLMELLAESLDVFQITCMASSFSALISGAILLLRRIEQPKGKYQWLSLLASGSLLAAGLPTALLSLKYMEIGASISVIYTMPIFAGIAGWIFLRERLNLVHVLFVILSLSGVLLIAQPEFIFGGAGQDPENDLFLGTMFGLISAVTFALLLVLARKQTMMGIPVFVMLFYNAVISCVFGALVCTITQNWSMPSLQNWFEMVGFAGADFCAQMLILMAIAVETAVLVSIAATSEVIFAFILQIIIFRDFPDWFTIGGAVLIVISCVGVAVSSPEHTADEEGVEEQEGGNDDKEMSGNGYNNNGVILDDEPDNVRSVKENMGDLPSVVTHPEVEHKVMIGGQDGEVVQMSHDEGRDDDGGKDITSNRYKDSVLEDGAENMGNVTHPVMNRGELSREEGENIGGGKAMTSNGSNNNEARLDDVAQSAGVVKEIGGES